MVGPLMIILSVIIVRIWEQMMERVFQRSSFVMSLTILSFNGQWEAIYMICEGQSFHCKA